MSNRRIYEGQIREQLALRDEHSKTLLRSFSSELFTAIPQALEKHGHLRLHRFGSFQLKWVGERRGRNPQTGEPLIIPAHARVVFTPAKALRDQVSAAQLDREEVEVPPAAAAGEPAAPAHAAPQPIPVEPQAEAAAEPAPPAVPNKSRLLPRAAMAAAILLALGLMLVYFEPGHEPPATESLADTQQATPAVAQALSESPAATLSKPVYSRPVEEASEPLARPQTSTDKHQPENLAMDDTSSTPAETPWFSERPHTLKNGDSLWRLSDRHYINPFYWPHIYQANRHSIRDPNRLIMGRTITLPSLQGKPGQLSDRDRRRIAEGYFLVYRHYKKNQRPYPYYALLGVQKFDPAVIEENIAEIDEKDWENLQLASN